MCRQIPRKHPCNHNSYHWNFCPSAAFDMQTSVQTPCFNQIFAKVQATDQPCKTFGCDYHNTGGSWTCCQCGGFNTGGWCVNKAKNGIWFRSLETGEMEWWDQCDHTCCVNCGRASDALGQSSQKNHKHRDRDSNGGESSKAGKASGSSTSKSSSRKHKTR